MEQTTHHVTGWVDRIDDIAVRTTDTALRADGSVPPPTVHSSSTAWTRPTSGI